MKGLAKHSILVGKEQLSARQMWLWMANLVLSHGSELSIKSVISRIWTQQSSRSLPVL